MDVLGSEWKLSTTVTASVFLSELVGQGNQNGSGGDEKMDAPPGLALNLTRPYKKRPATPSPAAAASRLLCL